MAQKNYYSGDLAAINAGRTADAAVQAGDQASLRNFIANLAQTRTRQRLGEDDIALRRDLGEAAIGVDRAGLDLNRLLGLEGLAVRRRGLDDVVAMNTADIAERAATREATTRYNFDFLRQRAQEATDRADELRRQYDLNLEYLQMGGGKDWRAQQAAADALAENEMQIAEADTAATLANSALQRAISSTTVPRLEMPGWSSQEDDRRFSYTNSPTFQTQVVADALASLDPSFQPLVQFRGPDRGFVPRFTRPMVPGSVADVPVAPILPSRRPWAQPRSVPLMSAPPPVAAPALPPGLSWEGFQTYRNR